MDDGELTRSKRFITKVLCESFFKGFLRGGRDVLGYLWMGLGGDLIFVDSNLKKSKTPYDQADCFNSLIL